MIVIPCYSPKHGQLGPRKPLSRANSICRLVFYPAGVMRECVTFHGRAAKMTWKNSWDADKLQYVNAAGGTSLKNGREQIY